MAYVHFFQRPRAFAHENVVGCPRFCRAASKVLRRIVSGTCWHDRRLRGVVHDQRIAQIRGRAADVGRAVALERAPERTELVPQGLGGDFGVPTRKAARRSARTFEIRIESVLEDAEAVLRGWKRRSPAQRLDSFQRSHAVRAIGAHASRACISHATVLRRARAGRTATDAEHHECAAQALSLNRRLGAKPFGRERITW